MKGANQLFYVPKDGILSLILSSRNRLPLIGSMQSQSQWQGLVNALLNVEVWRGIKVGVLLRFAGY